MTIDMKETLFEGNVTLDLWKSGLINIETIIFLPKEHASLEILEQIYTDCLFKRCSQKNLCFGHCDDNEIISYVKRDIWIGD